MTYQQALNYLYNLERFGVRLGLKNIKKIVKLLDNPQDKLNIIHIAGSNGKGSTAAFTASILKEAGYKVGLYTSPHLVDFRERIQINGQYISKVEVTRLFEHIRSIAQNHSLTYFEFVTIAAFLYFARNKVDFAVIEVGMGGRLDATNAIKKSLVAIITNIDFDHTEYLGETLAKIAFEKAGIIREKGIVITGSNNKQAIEVIKKVSRQKKARLLQLGQDLKASNYRLQEVGNQMFNYHGPGLVLRDLQIKLSGKHQVDNALCALGAVEVLINYGYRIKEEDIRRGLEKTKWPGRLELFKLSTVNCQLSTILLDGAHNPAGVKSLKNYLKSAIITFNRLIVVFGVLADKDIKGMLKLIIPLANIVIISKPNNERAANPELVSKQAQKYLSADKKIILTPDVKIAIDKALSLARKNDLICITGSLYTVGEARHIIAHS